MTPVPDMPGWFGRALGVVAIITVARLAALAFNHTDLFVDESQYWLWGQNIDFGYYSKPPLIAWVIRAVTDLAGSDTPFWIRMPGAVLHGVTALILAALAAHLSGARAAFWVATCYVTVPFVAVGSLLISTDTVMAPCFAAALYFWFRLAQSRAARWAILAGIAIGLAFLAKYAAAYFLLGAALSALFVPQMRVGWRNGLWLALAFGLCIAPNVIWNLTHDLATVSHTMDNIGWMRAAAPRTGLHPSKLAEFALNQFAVFGPLLFLAYLAALSRARSADQRALLLFSLPVLVIVCGQALLDRAYANWAVSAYFAGVVLVVPWLLARAPRFLKLALLVNGLVVVALPVLTITAPWPERNGKPLLSRYLGQSDLSRSIIAEAKARGAVAIYSDDRAVLADLFYTGAGSGLAFYAPKRAGRPLNYYEQNYPLPLTHGPVFYVLGGLLKDQQPVAEFARPAARGVLYGYLPSNTQNWNPDVAN